MWPVNEAYWDVSLCKQASVCGRLGALFAILMAYVTTHFHSQGPCLRFAIEGMIRPSMSWKWDVANVCLGLWVLSLRSWRVLLLQIAYFDCAGTGVVQVVPDERIGRGVRQSDSRGIGVYCKVVPGD